MSVTSFLSSWLPPVVWCGLIFYFSSIPGLNSGWGVWDLILRKCAHMFEYGMLVLMMMRAVRRTWSSFTFTGQSVIAVLFSLAYAASDEIHQAFVPKRGPSVHDVMIDTVGMVGAVFVARWFAASSARKKSAAGGHWIALLAVVLMLTGCGAESQFKRARGAETAGRTYEAWQRYQTFAAKHPSDPHAAEAVFRAGWLAQNVLEDCSAAKVFYDRVATAYPGSDPWAKLAFFQSANCPDYFPLVPGTTWVEGDSESGGKNARIEITCSASSGTANVPFSSGVLAREYFGGEAKFRTTELLYRKDGASVWEHTSDGGSRAVLQEPLTEGATWDSTLAGRKFHYEIVAASRTVTVRAGTFSGCLLVRSKSEGVPGATNEYYAPFVGRVLSSFQSEDGERRNIELLSYKPGDRDKFLP